MPTSMRTVSKILIWPVGIALVLVLYFSDNIRGYYRFKEICAKDAGLHVYQPLERNVGWMVSGGRMYDTAIPVNFKEVAFVRYHDEKDGNWYDVYRAPKLKVGDPGYARQPADLSKPVVYEFRFTQGGLENEVRMGFGVDEVIDLRTSKTAATYKVFSYGKFNPDNTILAAPSGEACPDDVFRRDPATGKALPMKRDLAYASMFIQ
ncbi:MAG: hypothetical protein ACOY95_06070 [Pseudomonadota bacterium]